MVFFFKHIGISYDVLIAHMKYERSDVFWLSPLCKHLLSVIVIIKYCGLEMCTLSMETGSFIGFWGSGFWLVHSFQFVFIFPDTIYNKDEHP